MHAAAGVSPRSATILVCTHNRAALLADTLASVARLQRPVACDVDLIVVDNNSADGTRQTIERASELGPFAIRYASESRQGKSYALNRGLSLSSGEIVACLDDDVRPRADWLVRIVASFGAEPRASFVYGKVLPRWETMPPEIFVNRRLQPIWGPLGLLDHGDAMVRHADDGVRRRLPIGGNVAFRRAALVAVGGWRIDLGKVDNSLICGEDHEVFLRLKRHGLYEGIYDPAVVVQHLVPDAKLRHAYFRRWFFWRGKTMARMADEIYRPLDLARCPRVAGVPRFLLRQFAEQSVRLAVRSIRGDRVDRLIEQVHAIEFLGMFSEFRQLSARTSGRTTGTA